VLVAGVRAPKLALPRRTLQLNARLRTFSKTTSAVRRVQLTRIAQLVLPLQVVAGAELLERVFLAMMPRHAQLVLRTITEVPLVPAELPACL